MPDSHSSKLFTQLMFPVYYCLVFQDYYAIEGSVVVVIVVLEACKDSFKKLQLDYLDLFLVHFPVASRHSGVGTTASALGDDGVLDIDTTISLETTWHAMEDLVSMGLVRSIGISNL